MTLLPLESSRATLGGKKNNHAREEAKIGRAQRTAGGKQAGRRTVFFSEALRRRTKGRVVREQTERRQGERVEERENETTRSWVFSPQPRACRTPPNVSHPRRTLAHPERPRWLRGLGPPRYRFSFWGDSTIHTALPWPLIQRSALPVERNSSEEARELPTTTAVCLLLKSFRREFTAAVIYDFCLDCSPSVLCPVTGIHNEQLAARPLLLS